MRKTQEIETMQDLEKEIRNSKIRLRNIQFFIDREITYAQEMISRSALPFPDALVHGTSRQVAYGNRERSIWQRFLKEAGEKLKTALMETAFSILIQQFHFKSQKQ